MSDDRLTQQLRFLLELDRLKSVFRQSRLIRTDRMENSAEHSWHLAMLAVVLAEYAAEDIDLVRVVKMALIHDIVEIDAGDTYIYDEQARQEQARIEQKAAERIFGLLPTQQATELRTLWEEFEAKQTPEARFAGALDRLQPLLLNYHTEGQMWRHHGISSEQVIKDKPGYRSGRPGPLGLREAAYSRRGRAGVSGAVGAISRQRSVISLQPLAISRHCGEGRNPGRCSCRLLLLRTSSAWHTLAARPLPGVS